MSVYETEEELAARIRELEAELDELNSSPWKARCQVARDDANTARQLAEFHRDRARVAEAEALEQAGLVRTWSDRAEKAEGDAREWKARAERWAESKESWKADAAEWQTRAEKAEATIERVREATAIWGGSQLRAAVLAALDPKPAFTLPTEAGTVIEATAKDGSYCQFVTITGLSHPAYAMGESIYWAEDVLGCFTGHRLLGADQ